MKLVERNGNTGSVCDSQRPGRQRVTSRQQAQHVFLTHDRFKTSVQTAQETREYIINTLVLQLLDDIYVNAILGTSKHTGAMY